ncbi:MAG TPA: PAS domain-containing protein [Pirellulales bacterium]|jgi:PAS domain S-box-containing protein|nr:PAS domain-containing protein [Pirellulales bacterium]
MTSDSKQNLLRYAFAIGSVALACLVWFCLTPLIGYRVTSAFILVAVLATGRFAGLGPSCLALIAGGVFLAYVEYLRFGTREFIALNIVVIYFFLGTILVLLTHSERTARQTADTNAERLRLLALQAPVGISLSDPEGRAFFVNQELCEIAGAEPEEFMGVGWRQFIHPDDRERLVETGRADIAAGKTSSSATFRFIRKDGSIRWASSTSSVVVDASGKPSGHVGVTEDITSRKIAEDALQAKEAQLRGILDHTSAVVYLKDLQGRYLVANRRHQTMFQRFGPTIVGKTDSEFFPPSIARQFIEFDQKVIDAKAPLVFEEHAPHDDGLHVYRSIKFPVMDEAGRMIAVGGISTDITDLQQAHDALRKNEKLLRNLIDVQENERHLLCHEFHDGLIQYAVGSLMALEGFQSGHLPSGAADASQIIDKAIANLRKGVDDGRRAIRGIRPAVLDDSPLEAALHDLIDQFPASEIMVKFDCDPEIGRLPNAVQTTVYRVVQEALNNAKRHSGTDVVRIQLRKSKDDLHLELRDFGCGFDVKIRAGGFGLLGMSERVRLLGGDCLIESEKEVGTTIKVRLPLADQPPADGSG